MISVRASRVIIGAFPAVQSAGCHACSPCHPLCRSDYSFPVAHSSLRVYFKNSFNLPKKKKSHNWHFCWSVTCGNCIWKLPASTYPAFILLLSPIQETRSSSESIISVPASSTSGSPSRVIYVSWRVGKLVVGRSGPGSLLGCPWGLGCPQVSGCGAGPLSPAMGHRPVQTFGG